MLRAYLEIHVSSNLVSSVFKIQNDLFLYKTDFVLRNPKNFEVLYQNSHSNHLLKTNPTKSPSSKGKRLNSQQVRIQTLINLNSLYQSQSPRDNEIQTHNGQV
jgi:hypothetical protein